MGTFLVALHVFAALFMILVVLLQSGKGAAMGAAFGGSSQTLFGSSGPASFLAKLTAIVAAVFMITSLSLSVLSDGAKSSSVMDSAPVQAPVGEEGGFDPFKAQPAAPQGAAPAAPASETGEKGQEGAQ